MLFDFYGQKLSVNISEGSSMTSKHTGASLSVLKVWLRIRGQTDNDKFLSLISTLQADSITSVNKKRLGSRRLPR